MPDSLLSQLFAPMPARQLLDEHWPSKALVAHGPLSRIPGAEELDLDVVLDAFAKVRVDGKDPLPPEAHVWFSDDAEKGWHTRQRKEECLVDAFAARILHDRKGGNLACRGESADPAGVDPGCQQVTRRQGRATSHHALPAASGEASATSPSPVARAASSGWTRAMSISYAGDESRSA